MSTGRLATLLRGDAVDLATAEDTRALGVELGRSLRAGDLVLLTGDLAAGKTTLTQGIGEGLEVRGPITSPTFVIARVHPAQRGGPDLVHVDAYRLGGIDELDDLDLDADLEQVVTVVEWGHGMAEVLSGDWLELVLTGPEDGLEQDGAGLVRADREGGPTGDATPAGDQPRQVTAIGHGPRWAEGG